jgi:hypothetical protein
MMEDLTRARTERLIAITDILESCQLMGEKADFDLIIEALWCAVRELGPDPEQPQPLTEEEARILCGIGTALKAVADMAALWAQTMQPGRIQRKLLNIRQAMHEDVLGPRMARLSQQQRNELFVRGTYWTYMIMEPLHQTAMLRIMERAAAGTRLNKVQRTNAAMFLRIMQSWYPIGQPKPDFLEDDVSLIGEVHSDAAGAD